MSLLDFSMMLAILLLAAGGLGAVYRIVVGPSILDRVLASDVLVIVISSGLCLDMILHQHTDNIIFVVVASVIGFVGSVTVSRFVAGRKVEGHRA